MSSGLGLQRQQQPKDVEIPSFFAEGTGFETMLLCRAHEVSFVMWKGLLCKSGDGSRRLGHAPRFAAGGRSMGSGRICCGVFRTAAPLGGLLGLLGAWGGFVQCAEAPTSTDYWRRGQHSKLPPHAPGASLCRPRGPLLHLPLLAHDRALAAARLASLRRTGGRPLLSRPPPTHSCLALPPVCARWGLAATSSHTCPLVFLAFCPLPASLASM